MTQLQYTTGSFRVSQPRSAHTPQQRMFGIAFALAMEGALIYALLVTLGYVEAPLARSPLTIVNVAPLPDEPYVPPPPPQTFEPPPVATIIAPVVELTYMPPTPPTVISLPPPAPTPTTPRVEASPAPPVVFTPPQAIRASHTTPEYPALARRLREQGTLRLKLVIDEKGLVIDAKLLSSSGFQRLDEAALKWVKAQWRYVPAKEGTKAVPSTAEAIVEFRLQ